MIKTVITTIICLLYLNVSATGAYGRVYYYKLELLDSIGSPITNKEVEVTIDNRTEIIKTDSLGILIIPIQRSSPCPVNKGSLKRLFLKDEWTGNTIDLKFNTYSFTICKNWKKEFRKNTEIQEKYDYQNLVFLNKNSYNSK